MTQRFRAESQPPVTCWLPLALVQKQSVRLVVLSHSHGQFLISHALALLHAREVVKAAHVTLVVSGSHGRVAVLALIAAGSYT